MDSILIVGGRGGTNVGDSFARAASALGLEVFFADMNDAFGSSRFLNALAWRGLDRTGPRAKAFRSALVERARASRPTYLLSTGLAAVDRKTLAEFGAVGTVCMHYSTDDPWNPMHHARWHKAALPAYDLVFTPRRSNLQDFVRLGCRNARYMPFAFDPSAIPPVPAAEDRPGKGVDVLFVGGADPERARFIGTILAANVKVTLVGDYWDRYPATRSHSFGHLQPERVAHLTRAAAVNLCLVRRANRDGHVMRSFEIAALGGCMVVEDTDEHREIFGEDGEAVVYCGDAGEAAAKLSGLLGDASLRKRLSGAVRTRIVGGRNTYRDRLETMLSQAERPAKDAPR